MQIAQSADKTILGISQNDIAETQGIEVTGILDTPADDPGLQFFVNTNFSAGDGASFVFSVTALAAVSSTECHYRLAPPLLVDDRDRLAFERRLSVGFTGRNQQHQFRSDR